MASAVGCAPPALAPGASNYPNKSQTQAAVDFIKSHAHQVMARLQNASTKEIFQGGLHEFITAFVEDNARLGQIIGEQYLFN